jgi:hypothetical protein
MRTRVKGAVGTAGSARRTELGAGQVIGIVFVLLFVTIGVGAYIALSNRTNQTQKLIAAMSSVAFSKLDLVTLAADGTEVPSITVGAELTKIATMIANNAAVSDGDVCAALFLNAGTMVSGPLDGTGAYCAAGGTTQQPIVISAAAATNFYKYLLVLTTPLNPEVLQALPVTPKNHSTTGTGSVSSGGGGGGPASSTTPAGPQVPPTPEPTEPPQATPTPSPEPQEPTPPVASDHNNLDNSAKAANQVEF